VIDQVYSFYPGIDFDRVDFDIGDNSRHIEYHTNQFRIRVCPEAD